MKKIININDRDRKSQEPAFDGGFEATRLRQATLGLALTPAQRLEWLERTVEEMKQICGIVNKKNQPR